MPLRKFKDTFRQARKFIIRLWRINIAIPRLLRYNPYTGFIGRQMFRYFPFLLPHDKSYFGFAHLVHKGDGLFLDVGANDGISAIGFRHIHSDYSILSIEPNLCHERSLRKLKKKLKRFDFKMIGAGSTRCQKILYVPTYNGVPIYTAASLIKDYVDMTMLEQHLPADHDKNIVIFECSVDIVPLDELGLQPDIIKIDSEGFDFEVILGLRKTIESQRPHIMIEYNPKLMESIEAFFKKLSYSFFTYDYPSGMFMILDKVRESDLYHQQKITTNIFCVPNEKSKALPVRQ